MKSGVKKLETSPYHMVEMYFNILDCRSVANECDRQTDKQDRWPLATAHFDIVRCAPKNTTTNRTDLLIPSHNL